MFAISASVAVIGAGIAGATIARELGRAGHKVQVFDKARGPGGRLATRRVEWVDRQGQSVTARVDHGAIGFTASSPPFQAFASDAQRAGCLAQWRPGLAKGSESLSGGALLYVPAPDMPALARHLLDGIPAAWSFAADGLHKCPTGWRVQAGDVLHASTFDVVVLALPPAQAAPLMNPYRPDWARHASIVPMQPCWTLMGIADDPEGISRWDLARPATGPLAWVLRSDSRPGRATVPGLAHWVAHARPSWTRRHLEQPGAWVQQEMQAALAGSLGKPVQWHHCTVHRWRYALPPARGTAQTASCWWDAALGLGVCGDFLGAGGVEGAWLSAQALSAALLQAGTGVIGGASPNAADVVTAAGNLHGSRRLAA